MSQIGHDKSMIDLNFYENRDVLPRKPKFGSFLTFTGADPGYVKRGGRDPKGGAGWLM